mgnify:CR=1 FL=1
MIRTHKLGNSDLDVSVLGLGCILLGSLVALREVGIWFGDQLVWPAGLVSFGIAAMWSRRPADRRDLLGRIGEESARPTLLRFAAGAFLIVGGAALGILIGSAAIWAVEWAGERAGPAGGVEPGAREHPWSRGTGRTGAATGRATRTTGAIRSATGGKMRRREEGGQPGTCSGGSDPARLS